MNFGEALQALKDGKRVAREGWNGKRMWLVLVEPMHPADRFNHGDPELSADKTRERQLGGRANVYAVGLDVPVPEQLKTQVGDPTAVVTCRDWLYATPTGGSGVRSLPWIGMKTADDAFVPWLASQTDLLADDWSIVS